MHLAIYFFGQLLHLAIYSLSHFKDEFDHFRTWPLFAHGNWLHFAIYSLGHFKDKFIIIALGHFLHLAFIFTWPAFVLGRHLMSKICTWPTFPLGKSLHLDFISWYPVSFGPKYSFGQIWSKRIFRSKRKVWPSNPHGQKERYRNFQAPDGRSQVT